ncbi:hypothetical protein K440DRAFT_664137 [Wilcoxina mikolae CBS 423.85]|nr:hypothetical protein K440DRAFT_664137 [Wilcoxina mikolae CBS 423.85]
MENQVSVDRHSHYDPYSGPNSRLHKMLDTIIKAHGADTISDILNRLSPVQGRKLHKPVVLSNNDAAAAQASPVAQDPDRIPDSANLRRSGRATKTTTKATAAATAPTSGNRRRSTRSITGDATAFSLPKMAAYPNSTVSQPAKTWAQDVCSEAANTGLSSKTNLPSNKSAQSSQISPASASKDTFSNKTSPQTLESTPNTSVNNTPNNLPIIRPELAQKLGCDPSDTTAASSRLVYVNTICEANGYPLKRPFHLIPADVCNMLITAVTEGVEWGWVEDDSRRVLIAICEENTAATALVGKEANEQQQQQQQQLEKEATPQQQSRLSQQPVSPKKRKVDAVTVEDSDREDVIPGRAIKKHKVSEQAGITKISAAPIITPPKSQRASSSPVARVASPIAKVATPTPQVPTPVAQVASLVAQVPSPPMEENSACFSALAELEETDIPAPMFDDDPTVATGLTIEEIFDNLVARCADLV